MRKTLGLCFLALTLTAATAHAQVFLEKGEPGTSAAVGGAAIGTGWSASVVPSYTYRGMFDVGVDLTWYGYNNSNSDASKLSAIGAMPFVNVYFYPRRDDTAKIALPVCGIGHSRGREANLHGQWFGAQS